MSTSTLDTLQALMRDVFMDATIHIEPASTALDVPGWDSLSHTLLVLEIESAFGVQLDLEKVAGCANVGELAGYIDALK